MCLIVRYNGGPYISSKNIEVYKVVSKTKNYGLITPIMRHPVKLKEVISGSVCLKYDNDIITSEGVHAYVNIDAAKKSSIYNSPIYNSYPDEQPVICKAIIPVGTLYWEGYYDEIAAREMIIIEIIELK